MSKQFSLVSLDMDDSFAYFHLSSSIMNGVTLSESNLLDFNLQPCSRDEQLERETCKIRGNLRQAYVDYI